MSIFCDSVPQIGAHKKEPQFQEKFDLTGAESS